MAKMNIVEMIAAQAAAGRIVADVATGVEVVMSPTNERYRLVDFDAERGRMGFAKILEDGTTEDKVRYLEGLGAKMAHYKFNPNPKPLAEAEIKGGKLIVNENLSVDLGNIKAQRVIGAVPGLVILGVGEPEDEELEVYTFNAQFSEDPDYVGTFKDAGFKVLTDAKVFVIEGVTYIVENNVYDVEIKDDKGNVTDVKQRCEASISNIYPIGDAENATVGKNSYESGSDPMDYEDYCYENDLDEDDDESYDLYEEYVASIGTTAFSMFDVPVESMRLVSQGNRKDIVVVTKMTTDDEGFLTDEEKPVIRLFRLGDFGQSVGTFFVKSADAKVFLGGPNDKAPTVLVVDDGVILVRDKFGLKVIDDAAVVDGLAGFTYFCDKEYDEETGTATYYFGNDADEVRGFSYKVTDRGTVVKLIQ